MVGFDYEKFINDLTFHVKNNNIPMSRINDAVQRILRVKFQMGLFENPLADTSLVNQVGSHEHRELAREDVRKSLVLLKNGKKEGAPMLPLPKKASKPVWRMDKHMARTSLQQSHYRYVSGTRALLFQDPT